MTFLGGVIGQPTWPSTPGRKDEHIAAARMVGDEGCTGREAYAALLGSAHPESRATAAAFGSSAPIWPPSGEKRGVRTPPPVHVSR